MRARQPRWRGLALAILFAVLAGCGATDPSSSAITSSPVPDTSAGNAAGPSPLPPPSPRPPAASPSPAPVAGPIGGTWRVRRILAPDHRDDLIPGTIYGEEAFVVRPTCDAEPCPTIEVSITPLGKASPITVATLTRQGDVYVSDAQAQNQSPCLNAFGDRIPGGAEVTSTLRLWLTKVRPAGTAVESTLLTGSDELALAPTPIGTAGGCEAQDAAYDLSGRREAIAIATARPTLRPSSGTGGGGGGPLTDLPKLGVKVPGAGIDYFAIEGSTADELTTSLARGGVKACGTINYEWHEGDQRPAACTITAFPGFEDDIDERTGADGTCSIRAADIQVDLVIHFPRWTAPPRVPSRLLDWWRDIVDFIRDHEAEHVRISRDAVEELDAALKGADCEDASDIIGGWARRLSAAQEAFDRVEYAKPWPQPPQGA